MTNKLTTLLLAFISTALLCFSQKAFTQVPSFVSPNTCLNANPATSTQAYAINANGTTITNVVLLGDLESVAPVPTFPTAANISYTLKSKNVGRDSTNNCVGNLSLTGAANFGYGRGVIRVFYTTGGCGSFIDLVINKKFTQKPPIVGPRCVSVGDTITYSVCSILSVNQNANIGQDAYGWNQTKVPLVLPIVGLDPVYTSGDNSSVTFRVLSNFTGGVLKCKFGVCQTAPTDSVTFTIGLKTGPSRINIISNGSAFGNGVANNSVTCVPTGPLNNSISLVLNPTTAGYTYTWSSNNPSWSFSTTTGSSTNLNANESAGVVYVTATGGCDSRRDTFIINRTLSAPLVIKRTDPPSDTCISPVRTLTFTVNNALNTANLAGVTFNWTAPAGWTVNSPSNGPTVTITATATAVGGNVVVKSAGCTSDSLALFVSVKPAKPSPITGTFCLTQGSTAVQTYSVPAVPGATSYIWTNNASPAWSGTSTTNTINYLPSGTSVGAISVRAVGGNCIGDTVQRVLNFNPVIPTNITQNCIPGGIACTTTLSAVGGAGTYEWIIPAGLGTPANPTGATPTISTTGTPGSYTPQVRCTNVCGSTAYFPKTIVISPLPKIDSTPGGSFTVYSVNNTGACTPASYCWKQNNTGACVSTASNILLQNGGASNYTVQITYAGCGATLNLSTPTKYSSRPAAAGGKASLNDATVNPNPAKDAFTIVLPATNGNTTVSIYNSKGALVKQQICKTGNNKFTTANWANGEYIIKLTSTKGETVTKKLMVNK